MCKQYREEEQAVSNTRLQPINNSSYIARQVLPRPLQVESMADSVSQYRGAHAGCAIPMKILCIARLHDLMIDGEVANIAACVRSGDVGKGDACAFECFEDYLKKFSLLGVHISCFHCIDGEEIIVECTQVFIDEVPSLSVHASWSICSLGMIECIYVEATLGHFALAASSLL